MQHQTSPRRWRGRVLFAAAMAALLIPAASHAGSVTQPGETIGLATGAPLPEGWYALDTTDYGQRTPPSDVYVAATIPVLAWSTPYYFAGAQVQALVAAPAVEAGTSSSHADGWYNPWFAGQLAWNFGNGFSVSLLQGLYAGVHSPVADHGASLNERLGINYVTGGMDVMVNNIYGIQLGANHSNPDFYNLDVTAAEGFGKWSFGPVGYYSTDTSKPFSGYKAQSQLALGALVGYNTGPVILQTYLTRGVAQSNYGGDDTRFWFRILVPFA